MSIIKDLNLDSDEYIILEVRKHWFIFLGPVGGFILGAILPFVVYFILASGILFKGFKFELSGQSINIAIFVYAIWLLGLWMFVFLEWTRYYLDVWYVTNKRIIDIDQKDIFHRAVSNLRFDKIQDISVEVNGIIATFFDFGDIHVQTAGESSREFLIMGARNPETAKKIIFTQHHRVAERFQPVTIKKTDAVCKDPLPQEKLQS